MGEPKRKYKPRETTKNTYKILLSQGKETVIDGDDVLKVLNYKWHHSYGYAVGSCIGDDGKRRTIFLHRVIMDTPEGMFTDHINGDRLDNRKSNLRICTMQQNAFNRKDRKNKTGFRGVSFHPTKRGTKKYEASIRVDGIKKFIGLFSTPEEAARAYDEKAKIIHGDFYYGES